MKVIIDTDKLSVRWKRINATSYYYNKEGQPQWEMRKGKWLGIIVKERNGYYYSLHCWVGGVYRKNDAKTLRTAKNRVKRWLLQERLEIVDILKELQ